jgi:hypothetical protein
MKKNVGSIDKVIRIILAVLIVILAITHVITGTLAVVMLILAGIFVITTLISFCPIWWALGFGTAKKELEKKQAGA